MRYAHRKDRIHRSLSILRNLIPVVLIICSCATKPVSDKGTPGPLVSHQDTNADCVISKSASDKERLIREVVERWSGTPHKLGGLDRTGIDCSGFVQRIYKDLFHIQLPRTTQLQSQIGTSVTPDRLSTGDLVFFHPPNKIRHVGIYLSNGEFAHASASHGVIISTLKSAYWRDAYWTSKHILPDNL